MRWGVTYIKGLGLQLEGNASGRNNWVLLSFLLCADHSDHYDPDYEFLQQDLSNADQIPQQGPSILSPLPESLGESGSPFHGHSFQTPQGSSPQPEHCGTLVAMQSTETPPALPEKKRRSAASQTSDNTSCRVSYERHPSQYDNISEDDTQNPGALPSIPFPPFAAVLPFQQGNSSAPIEFITTFAAPDSTGDAEKPPPLPEKKNKHSKPLPLLVFLHVLPSLRASVLWVIMPQPPKARRLSLPPHQYFQTQGRARSAVNIYGSLKHCCFL